MNDVKPEAKAIFLEALDCQGADELVRAGLIPSARPWGTLETPTIILVSLEQVSRREIGWV